MRKLFIVACALVFIFVYGITQAQSVCVSNCIYLPLSLKPVSTPTPLPNGVVATKSSTFVPYSGASSVYLIGEVTNNTNKIVQFVKINAILRNDAGQIVDGDYSYTTIDTLAPGMISPFLIIFDKPPVWSSYETTVTWSTTTRAPIQLATSNIETYWDSSNAYHVRGVVSNQTGSQRTFVKVFVTMYDVSDKIIGVDYDYIDPLTIEAGQSAPFDVSVYFWNGKPDRSRVARFDVRAYDD